MRGLLLVLLVGLMLGLQALGGGILGELGPRAVLVFGFLLLVGFLLGEILAPYGLPRVTGYLLAGMATGPSALGLVDEEVVAHLGLIDELALALIAFTAGAELKVDRLRARIGCIALTTGIQSLVVFVGATAVAWLASPLFPFAAGLSGGERVGVAAVFGLIATATSPATTVAVIVESRARGSLTDTILGTVMLKDIVVLVGWSVLLSFVGPAFASGGASEAPRLLVVLAEVLVSLPVGALIGGGMILYLRHVARDLVVFVLAAGFLLISLSHAFHLDSLLVAMAAGFTVSNLSNRARVFIAGLERASGPVFLVFFCLAGASLDLHVLLRSAHLVAILVAARLLFTWAGTGLGVLAARDEAKVRRHAWTGFIGQAGLSLGLAAVIRGGFGPLGTPIADLVVGGIVVNQILGPILFRRALLRSGEGR